MKTAHIAIVGGGLSGLYAAYLLEQKGIRDYVLLEARNVPGGRILSVAPFQYQPWQHPASGADAINRFDLAPSWFWPGFQPQLDRLVCAGRHGPDPASRLRPFPQRRPDKRTSPT